MTRITAAERLLPLMVRRILVNLAEENAMDRFAPFCDLMSNTDFGAQGKLINSNGDVFEGSFEFGRIGSTGRYAFAS